MVALEPTARPVVTIRTAERPSADVAGVRHLPLRFSTMATVPIVAILVSGILNTAFRVGIPTITEASSAYGLTLVVKIGLVAGMLALAALNRFVPMSRLEQTLIRAVTAAIAAEFALGILTRGRRSFKDHAAAALSGPFHKFRR